MFYQKNLSQTNKQINKDVKQSKNEINSINNELKKVHYLGEDLEQNKSKINCLSEELEQNKKKVTHLSNSLFNMENTCNMLQATVESLKEKSDSNLTSQQNITLEDASLSLPSGQKMPSQKQENSMIIDPSSVA